jgi:uncharacterized membrane protein YecN with MAPEG domain
MGDGIHAAGLWIALCILLLLVLSGLTSANRRKHRISLGEGGNAAMTSASRAFGNAAEYMPIALVALVALALTNHQAWSIHLIGAAFFLGRVSHAIGMFKTVEGQKPRIERMIGMLLTYLPLLASAVLLICCWFGSR